MRCLVALVGLSAVCSGCVAPDCDNKDCGSCGNACCRLEFAFAQSPYEVVHAINTSLGVGGPDGRYFALPLAEGPTGFVALPPSVEASYIGQAIHTTFRRQYNDTVNFEILETPTHTTLVRCFSISQLGGSYCDAGQNFKNIVTLMKPVYSLFGLGFKYKHLDKSCPGPDIDLLQTNRN
mmetsp:Transcript_15015/g.27027  ORF Transcript_15015/g.27027 Transcript_15015/m.27027 type:complete len:179 (+) Transcript_15015:65-601(+)